MNKEDSPIRVGVNYYADKPYIRYVAMLDLYSFEKLSQEYLAGCVAAMSEKIIGDVSERISKELSEKLYNDILSKIDQTALSTMVLAKVVAKIAEKL